MEETKSILRAAQNNATMTNNIKTPIDNTQQNNKHRLRGDREETIT